MPPEQIDRAVGALLALALDLAAADQAIEPRAGLASIKGADQPHSHLLWLRLSYSSIVKLPFVCVVAHDRKSRRWATAVNAKPLLPPRQSRGSPGYASPSLLEPARAIARWLRWTPDASSAFCSIGFSLNVCFGA